MMPIGRGCNKVSDTRFTWLDFLCFVLRLLFALRDADDLRLTCLDMPLDCCCFSALHSCSSLLHCVDSSSSCCCCCRTCCCRMFFAYSMYCISYCSSSFSDSKSGDTNRDEILLLLFWLSRPISSFKEAHCST